MSPIRLLLCTDTSPAALQAAQVAVRLAADQGGEIRALSVSEDGETARRLDARAREHRPAGERFERGMRSTLDRVVAMAHEHDVPVDTEILHGDPLKAILRDARKWHPDLILIGRTGRSGPGSPMMGSLAIHLVEFSDWPVVVVPEGTSRARGR